jgi:SEL1 protein
MYLRGEGVGQNPAMARMWFERGSAAGDRECHNALGVIWRDGLVLGQTNEKKALAFFNAAAAQELAEAQVHLGKHYYSELPYILLHF